MVYGELGKLISRLSEITSVAYIIVMLSRTSFLSLRARRRAAILFLQASPPPP